jgi:M6 family metalloprotease-like protein
MACGFLCNKAGLLSALLAALAMLTSATFANAAPRYLGTGDEPDHFHAYERNLVHVLGGTDADQSASLGKFNLLVVPVHFSDVDLGDFLEGLNTSDTSDVQYWEELFFGDGTGTKYPYPSVRQYYLDQSYGTFELDGEIADPVSLANTLEYYGTLNGQANGGIRSPSAPGIRALLTEVILELESRGYDLLEYVNNSSGRVDGIAILHAGPGGQNVPADDGGEKFIWSHVADRSFTIAGAKRSVRYMAVAETFYLPSQRRHVPSGVGVIAHEFGHILGLIDLYDMAGRAQGVGHYSIMGHGLYDLAPVDPDSLFGPDIRPKSFDPHSKRELGWIKPQEIDQNNCFLTMDSSSATTPTFLQTSFSASNYVLLEYRKNTEWDAELPRSGVLAWRIDELSPLNVSCAPTPADSCRSLHPIVSVMQADGLFELDSSDVGSFMDERDYFVAGSVLSSNSSPALESWDGESTSTEYRFLRETGGEYVLHALAQPGELKAEPFLGGAPTMPEAVGDKFVWAPKLDPADETARYTLVSAPEGTVFNSDTGRVEWVATKPGQYVFVVQVETCSGSDQRTFNVFVAEEKAGGCQMGSGPSSPRALLSMLFVFGVVWVRHRSYGSKSAKAKK